jgi:predicted nucleotidyltransferase
MAELLEGTAALEPFIGRIKHENELEAKHAGKLHKDAFEEARRLAREMGTADPELRKVILFGSALPGRMFRSDSDVDLAVVGGHAACFERIADASTFHVDIVVLDDVRDGIKESILKEGLVLYEASKS